MGIPFSTPTSSATIVIDASLVEWDIHLNSHTVQDIQTLQEAKLHIYILELQAVSLACKAFLPLICSLCIQVMLDNITTLVCINKLGGARSHLLCLEAVRLWKTCIGYITIIQAAYLLGVYNSLADNLSRHFAVVHDRKSMNLFSHFHVVRHTSMGPLWLNGNTSLPG